MSAAEAPRGSGILGDACLRVYLRTSGPIITKFGVQFCLYKTHPHTKFRLSIFVRSPANHNQRFPPPSSELSGRESPGEGGGKSFDRKNFFVFEPIWTKIGRYIAGTEGQLHTKFQSSTSLCSPASTDQNLQKCAFFQELVAKKRKRVGAAWEGSKSKSGNFVGKWPEGK